MLLMVKLLARGSGVAPTGAVQPGSEAPFEYVYGESPPCGCNSVAAFPVLASPVTAVWGVGKVTHGNERVTVTPTAGAGL